MSGMAFDLPRNYSSYSYRRGSKMTDQTTGTTSAGGEGEQTEGVASTSSTPDWAKRIDGQWYSPLISIAIIAVIGWGLWSLASWLFHLAFGSGAGTLYNVLSASLVIGFLVALLGILIPLPFFLGSRLVALVAILAMAFFGVPTVQKLRTPEQVAKEEALDRPVATDNREPSDVAVLAGAQLAIKARAVAPGSVRFRNLSVHRQDNGSKAVCGEFNAKNRAGGYNGFEPFISAGVAEHTWTREDVTDFSKAWNTLCSH